MSTIPLSGDDWRIHEDAEGKGVEHRLFDADTSLAGWLPATVPGNIQSDLEAAHELHPLWYGVGDPRLAEVAKKDWWYRRDFVIPSSMEGQRLKLVFDGVDHECEVWLNGHRLGNHAGMYRRFGFDVAAFVKPGETNRLAIRISRIPEPLIACIADSETRGGGKVNTSNKHICMMLKELKSPTNCAWDWAVAVYTLGIWRDVRLEASGAARIEWTRVQTDLRADHSRATVRVKLEVDALDAINTKTRLAILGHGATATSVVDAALNAGTNMIDAELALERPALWWPNGHGDQPLYRLKVVLEDAQTGQELDTRSVRFGVRDIRWEQTPGTPHDFINPLKLVVNGRPVRQMGSNLIPPDSLFGRMEARGLRLLDLAHAAGINCFRLWGGGVTLSEAMYDRADELGIMLMQEFFLANYTPETNAVFLANLEETAINIVKQVRNHPSIVEWGGGNEMTWRNGDDHPALRVLEKVVREEDGRIFRATEPAQGSGSHGSYTYVYHAEPAPQLSWLGAKEQNLYQRYNNPGNIMRLSEFGCNSPANLEVWYREIPPASQWPLSDYEDPVLIRKNVFYGAALKENWLHKELIERLFGPLDRLEDLVHAGQFLGAEGLRYAMDALRRQGPALGGGFMSWDYNEPWPNGAGSYMVDYDGRPLMNYDFVKQALTPVSLVLKYDDLLYDPVKGVSADLFLVSDATARVENVNWSWIARDRRGEIFDSGKGAAAINPVEVKALDSLSLRPPAKTVFGPIFVELRLADASGKTLTERLHVFGAGGIEAPFAGLLRNMGEDRDDEPSESPVAKPPDRWRPVRRTTLQVVAQPVRFEGEQEVLDLNVKNTGPMTALYVEPHPLIAYRTDLFIENNHAFIPPGESRTISIRALDRSKGGLSLRQTGWRLSTWNADERVIEPDADVLLAVGRRDQMCREYSGYFDKDPAKEDLRQPVLIGNRPDPTTLPYLLNGGKSARFEFAANEVQIKRGARLRIHTADQSKDASALVRVTVNGKLFDQTLPVGIGLQRADPAHLAFPSTLTFEIPSGILLSGENVLEIHIKNDGWFTWDALDLVTDEVVIETLEEASDWLETRTGQMVNDCRRTMTNGVAAYPPQVGSGYKAFWLRDYAYILEGAAAWIPREELLAAAHLFVNSISQDGEGVDCVMYDGTPIYKPGYGRMGENAVADGSPFTVAVAYLTWKRTGDASLLSTNVLDKLVQTMNAMPRDSATGLVTIDPSKKWDRCPYGFTDTVKKTGLCFFESLLDVEASRRLAEMMIAAGREEDARTFSARAESIAEQINAVFWDEDLQLYRAATVQCREGDIWGSAFAVWLGVASDERADKIAAYFRANHSGLTQKGQLRHTPPGVYWEKGCPKDTYQNGAYWGTPVGWYAYTLNRIDPALADRTLVELVSDYAKRGVGEWVFGDKVRLPGGYMSSATLPLQGIRRLMAEREAKGQD